MDERTKRSLIEGLNRDLAGEYQAILQYLTYAARVSGPLRPELSAFFTREIQDELGHAQFLANKIVALGGEPTTEPKAVPHAETNQEMLQKVLEAERTAIRDYTERAKQAEEAGDKGLQVRLEDIVADETTHAEETARILQEWSL